MKKICAFVLFVLAVSGSFAQGLEDVIVETYYISDANDATDTDGGNLPAGSVTYRIYVDMAPGYEIQAVYGNANHQLRIATTTQFFNNVDRGELTGGAINDARVDENTVALDSWLSMGPATDAHFGVLKTEDLNGSIVGGVNNDGGSQNIAGGLLVNANPLAGIPLTTADGLVPSAIPVLTLVGISPTMFDNVNSPDEFITNGGAWSALEGVVGITATNRVLVAQITTNGELSFELNVQLGAPNGDVEKYVASNPISDETFFAALTFPQTGVQEGCTNPAACNFNAAATEDDDSCLIPVPNCQVCNGNNTALVIVDADGDGICNANEIAGCTNPTACNFNSAATDDNGSCLIPVPNCSACNANNTALVIVDADGDGICNANEIAGCTNAAACNFNSLATDENGSCLIPVANCLACNTNNTALVIVDADGDGICNANEIQGCTNPAACNFDPLATDNDGSCIVPVANCQVCNSGNDGLVIVDTDSDGVCDAQEVFGCTDELALNFNPAATEDNGTCSYEVIADCTSPTACNFNPFATEDDGSCIEPIANCQICNTSNDGLVIVDTDADGICNAEEIAGCTSPTACNFDADATDDDGSCTEPELNCSICAGDVLIIVDADNDGICDAQEVDGCTNSLACNFNPAATEEDGSCIIPVPNCQICNSENTGLIIVDTDGDGICDAQEIEGCLSETACNYNPDATDAGTCIEPVLNCQECNANNTGLVIVDSDSDGVCDAEEIAGCTDPAANNYNPDATDDDGSCEYDPTQGCGGGLGLENVIVERYYISDANDSGDEDGGSELALGSTTYRVYVDMAPGYELQAVYGNANHTLRIETSTLFYNNADRGERTGDVLPANRLDENTVALDSYLTIGAASDSHWGVLKADDEDGSIVGGSNNDGGSQGVSGGLLVNDDALAGIPLTTADGLLAGTVPTVTVVGLDLSIFDNENAGPIYTTNGGAWSILEGAQGPTAANRILVAQLTTDGDLSFELNLQLGTPDGGVEKYVAINPVDNEFQCDLLVYPSLAVTGCTDVLAANYNPDASTDDGSCTYDFEICDCNQELFSPALRFEVGNGTPNNDGPGGNPDFDCWAWAFDCGDIAGLPSEDPFGVCNGNLPDDNNCGLNVDESTATGILIYPNPSNGNVRIASQGLSGMAELLIYDHVGRVVVRRSMVLSSGSSVDLDCMHLASGVYQVRMNIDDVVTHTQIVIQR